LKNIGHIQSFVSIQDMQAFEHDKKICSSFRTEVQNPKKLPGHRTGEKLLRMQTKDEAGLSI
jgi:hypothetical protein